MGRQTTLFDMVACRLLIYTPMGWIPAVSIASTTKGKSHSPPALRSSVISVIRCSTWWWNSSRTMIISLVTTHIYLPYKSTDCATALYIAPQARTVSTVLSVTLYNIPYSLRAFCRFW